MIRRSILMIVLPAIFLLSCAASQPPDMSKVGPFPTLGDPEPQIREAMDGILRDPYSAQYRRIGGPVAGRVQAPLIAGGKVEDGWGYCYGVNAKNGFGGYTGYQPYYFLFRYDRLIGYAPNPQLSSWNCFN